jgi:hypothetical protein
MLSSVTVVTCRITIGLSYIPVLCIYHKIHCHPSIEVAGEHISVCAHFERHEWSFILGFVWRFG